MSLAYKISSFNRKRKWRIFKELFAINPQLNILDIGFSEKEYSDTDNFLEKNYPYPEKITALGVDSPKEFLIRYPKVKAISYDGINFPFADKLFDICWSNAVIEHVGDREKQLHFLKEVRRVAKSGFITTPNRKFPIEVHTRIPLLHYLPKRIFDKFLNLINKGWASGDYMHLLSISETKELLAKAGFKNYKIIKNRLLWTLDFIIYFNDN